MASKTKKTAKYFDIQDFLDMASACGLEDNPLFLQTLKNYETIQKSLALINGIIEAEDSTVSKEYVKGRENVYAHPLIKELPKQIEAANKVAHTLLDIIETLGTQEKQDELMEFIKR